MAPAGAGGESALEVALHQRLAAAQAQRAGGGAVALAGTRQRGAAAAFLKRTAAQIGPGQTRIGFQGEGITRLQRPAQLSEYLRGAGAVIGAQRLSLRRRARRRWPRSWPLRSYTGGMDAVMGLIS